MLGLKFVFASLLLAIFASGVVHGKLKGAAILFRHGERTPSSTLPNYGMNAITTDLGVGQLTLAGSAQHYKNGLAFRTRYLSLFPQSGYYRLSNMKILSSPVERCVVSLSSFMAGFFPPPANDKTIPFRWQSFPFAQDNEARVVILNPAQCPKFLADWTAARAALPLNSWYARDATCLTRVGQHMGVTLNSFDLIMFAADLVRTNQYLEKTPQWLLDDFKNCLEEYVRVYFEVEHSTTLMRKVRGGPMLTQIVDNMYALSNNNATMAKNLLVYSAHDLTVTSLVKVLGVESQVPPLSFYADTISVELHQIGTAEPTVQVWYTSSTVDKPYVKQLNVPNCGYSCTLNKFKTAVSQYLVTDYNAMCGI